MNKLDYFTAGGFSSSKIKMYEENFDMLHFINSDVFDKEDKEKTTKALFFGEMFHLAVLEPTEFAERKESILDQLTPMERQHFACMLKSMPSNTTAINLIKNAKFVECPFFSKYEIEFDGRKETVVLKAFIDLYTKKNVLVDLKTVASLTNFYKQFKKYRYDLQLAFYKRILELNGLQVDNVILICAEKKQPYGWQCFYIPESELICGEFGAGKYRGFIEIMSEMFFAPRKRFEDEIVVLEKEGAFSFE